MALSGKSGVSGGIDVRGTVVGEAVFTASTTAAAVDALGQVTANQLTALTSGAANYAITASADSVLPAAGDAATVTLTAAGTYLILAKCDLLLSGGTTVADRTVTLKLRRMNNTAADLTGGAVTVHTGINTTNTISIPGGYWWVVYATTATNDIINILASIDTVPSAGTLDITKASIVAFRLQQ